MKYDLYLLPPEVLINIKRYVLLIKIQPILQCVLYDIGNYTAYNTFRKNLTQYDIDNLQNYCSNLLKRKELSGICQKILFWDSLLAQKYRYLDIRPLVLNYNK